MFVCLRATHRGPESRRRLQGPGREPCGRSRMGERPEGGVGAWKAGGTHLRVLLNFHHCYHSGMLVGVKDYLVTFVFR